MSQPEIQTAPEDQISSSDRPSRQSTVELAEALLQERTLNPPFKIGFCCYGIPFTAVVEDTADGPRMKLAGVVGAVPFTGESAAARKLVKSVLAREPHHSIAKLSVTERQNIVVNGEATLNGEATPPRIIATATAIIATAKPLIDIMKLCLLTPTPRDNVA